MAPRRASSQSEAGSGTVTAPRSPWWKPRSADLGIRPDAKGTMAIPDGGLDRLRTYPIKNEMYVLAAIR